KCMRPRRRATAWSRRNQCMLAGSRGWRRWLPRAAAPRYWSPALELRFGYRATPRPLRARGRSGRGRRLLPRRPPPARKEDEGAQEVDGRQGDRLGGRKTVAVLLHGRSLHGEPRGLRRVARLARGSGGRRGCAELRQRRRDVSLHGDRGTDLKRFDPRWLSRAGQFTFLSLVRA